jgi:ATP-dependent helicase/nuclease subunit A
VSRVRTPTPEQSAALDLDRHTAVAAGAGSGKTFVLVERYLRALDAVRARPSALSRVVAVTFTERATAEMRARVRAGVRERLASARKQGDRESVAYWREIIGQLHEARIATLHGLCASILRDHPLEAGVDPDFEIVDAPRAEALIEEAVNATLGGLGRRDPRDDEGAAALRRLLESYRPTELRIVLTKLLWRRDLATAWIDARTSAPGPSTEAEARERLGASVERVRELVGPSRLTWITTTQGPRGDKLTLVLDATAGLARSMLTGEVTVEVVRARLGDLLTEKGEGRKFSVGRKEAWAHGIEEAREHLRGFAGAIARELAWVVTYDPRNEALAAANEQDLATVFETAAGEHARLLGSRLDFAGLEIATVALLRDPRVRARAQAGIDHLLVDEFQDTSPLQWTLVRSLVPEGPRTDDAPAPTLFFVGDDKQAVYEFRGGRVEVFREAQAWIEANGGRLVTLADNYRTLPEIIAVVNELSQSLFDPTQAKPFEPLPTSLVARRSGRGAVEILLHDADEAWPGEAERIATHLASLVQGGVEIVDGQGGALRPLGWRDIAVVVPFRRDFTHLEDAFAAAGIPFQVLGGLGFFQTLEVSDVRSLLRALLDPEDAISTAALLRSPFFSFSDVLLWKIARSAEGRLNFLEGFRGPIGPTSPGTSWDKPELALWTGAREAIERWRGVVGRIPTSTLLTQVMEETRLRDVLLSVRTGPRMAANMEKLLDLVREIEHRNGIDPAAVVNWLDAQAEKVVDEGEATEIGLREGVSILTIHKSKGCEFPIVVVAGLADRPSTPDGAPIVLSDHGPSVRIGLKVPSADSGYETDTLARSYRYSEIEAHEKDRRRAEMKRILYVAMTRARDRLVLSTQTNAVSGAATQLLARNAECATAFAATVDGEMTIGGGPVRVLAPSGEVTSSTGATWAPTAPAGSGRDDLGAFEPLLDSLVVAEPVVRPVLVGAARLRSFSVSAFAEAVRAERSETTSDAINEGGQLSLMAPERGTPEGATLPDESTMEAALALGTRVHQVLASIRHADDAWSVEGEAARHVRSFLSSPRAASVFAASRAFAEVRFVLPAGDARVEGMIDRLYLDGDVWTVLDFKTTALRRGARIEEIVHENAIDEQLRWYAAAAARILGLPASALVRTVAFFTHPAVAATSGAAEYVKEIRAGELPCQSPSSVVRLDACRRVHDRKVSRRQASEAT